MFHKTKNRNKKYFFKNCLQCFSSRKVLTKHKEICLSINCAQSLRLVKETFKFKKFFKQIPVPFKIYADLSIIQKMSKVTKTLTQKNIKITFLIVLLTIWFVLLINLPSQQLFLGVKKLLMNMLKQFLKSVSIVKK